MIGRGESSKTSNSPLVEMIPKDTTEEQREIERTIMVTANINNDNYKGQRCIKGLNKLSLRHPLELQVIAWVALAIKYEKLQKYTENLSYFIYISIYSWDTRAVPLLT